MKRPPWRPCAATFVSSAWRAPSLISVVVSNVTPRRGGRSEDHTLDDPGPDPGGHDLGGDHHRKDHHQHQAGLIPIEVGERGIERHAEPTAADEAEHGG